MYKKVHDCVKTTIKIKSWKSPYKVWAHSHILFLKRGAYEVGKRRQRMTKFSVSPNVYEPGRKRGLLVFSEYVLAEYFLCTQGFFF